MQFKKNQIGSIVFPNKDNVPMFNHYGMYGCKLMFNGCERLIELDDSILVKRGGNQMTHSLIKDEFAPSLLEKCIYTLYGPQYIGLETNPSIEMHHFIGWIPETVKFSDVNNKDNLWARMKQNFKEGNIILSIGKEKPESEQ
jgi:hypothetical protein